jgi:hypothetical protein
LHATGGRSHNLITCPACGRELWEKHVGFEIGTESAHCKCGALVATGKREWIHLTAAERQSFWAARRILPVSLTVFLTTGIVFGSLRNHTSGKSGLSFDWHITIWCLVASIALFALDLATKFVAVRRSLRRFPVGTEQDSARPE